MESLIDEKLGAKLKTIQLETKERGKQVWLEKICPRIDKNKMNKSRNHYRHGKVVLILPCTRYSKLGIVEEDVEDLKYFFQCDMPNYIIETDCDFFCRGNIWIYYQLPQT